ncbi:MAG: pyrroline-5-carboxylate reductase [Pseudomonadota bacterium]
MSRIGVIGVGNMGAALVKGLIASGKSSGSDIVVFDVDQAKVRSLADECSVGISASAVGTVEHGTDIVLLAVKPQVVGAALDEISPAVGPAALVISIAAGISTEFILSHLNPKARVIRAMPNAAAMVGQSATAVCKGGAADDSDLGTALDLFAAIGKAVPVPEKIMNVVTALSGSGPGYLFVIMEALTDGAVLMGLDRPTARALAVQTVLGSAEIAMKDGAPFGELKDRITSPGGTTIAGLRTMERAGLRGILMDTVAAATLRGEELSSGK